ncbi:Uncharacterised protein [Yersinia pekkanenii]|uniref:Uncharacterized protein n=1 Tax=Yersinia pekkanenii TaxID=1288385 RepID=A0A0T9R074_9GAMM|nr:hypothetical protein [Yersinia pekkanenii]CNI37628.1 Uncharacterised protein [Yersinia pekkanenii]CRY66638.1 Uncharacterised protein [Yersinia pekkanenii]
MTRKSLLTLPLSPEENYEVLMHYDDGTCLAFRFSSPEKVTQTQIERLNLFSPQVIPRIEEILKCKLGE